VSGIADRILAPVSDAGCVGRIGTLTLPAASTTAAQDCTGGVGGRYYFTARANVVWYVIFGDDPIGVSTPNPATLGWLNTGVADGRCYGPIQPGEELHREIGPESRYARFYAETAGVLRAYLSSPDAQGAPPPLY
jgi:hypothetical protein